MGWGRVGTKSWLLIPLMCIGSDCSDQRVVDAPGALAGAGRRGKNVSSKILQDVGKNQD
jgi:hypothetical protein